jgi:hypothetical protein
LAPGEETRLQVAVETGGTRSSEELLATAVLLITDGNPPNVSLPIQVNVKPRFVAQPQALVLCLPGGREERFMVRFLDNPDVKIVGVSAQHSWVKATIEARSRDRDGTWSIDMAVDASDVPGGMETSAPRILTDNKYYPAITVPIHILRNAKYEATRRFSGQP